MVYQGSCHCGAVAFEVDGELKQVTDCNCSICSRCGIHPFGEASDQAGNRMAAVNVRCLEGVDLASLPVKHFDGKAL